MTLTSLYTLITSDGDDTLCSKVTLINLFVEEDLKTGYLHHIERLMVLGNFMLLCEFDPDEVYRWFMELFIDSYDWVMVPNIYGMSQFADGGLMSTKPYISSSTVPIIYVESLEHLLNEDLNYPLPL